MKQGKTRTPKTNETRSVVSLTKDTRPIMTTWTSAVTDPSLMRKVRVPPFLAARSIDSVVCSQNSRGLHPHPHRHTDTHTSITHSDIRRTHISPLTHSRISHNLSYTPRYLHTHTHTYARTHTHTHTLTHTHTHTHARAREDTRVYTHMCVYTHITHPLTLTHTYTHTHSPWYSFDRPTKLWR